MKVHPFTPKTNECVLSVLIELLDHPGEIQVQATFAIGKSKQTPATILEPTLTLTLTRAAVPARLVSDDAELQVLACDTYDCMKKLAGLLEKSNAAASSSYVLRTETVPSRTEENVIVDETLIRLREVSRNTAEVKKNAAAIFMFAFDRRAHSQRLRRLLSNGTSYDECLQTRLHLRYCHSSYPHWLQERWASVSPHADLSALSAGVSAS